MPPAGIRFSPAGGGSRKKQGGSHFPFFSGKDIEGPANGTDIHDFNPFSCLHEWLQQFGVGKSKEVAGSKQDDLGVERGEESEISVRKGIKT